MCLWVYKLKSGRVKKSVTYGGEDLLYDKKIEKRIKEELELYFKINVAVDISEATVWEAHKAYIRGILFMAGSEKKKELKKTN